MPIFLVNYFFSKNKFIKKKISMQNKCPNPTPMFHAHIYNLFEANVGRNLNEVECDLITILLNLFESFEMKKFANEDYYNSS